MSPQQDKPSGETADTTSEEDLLRTGYGKALELMRNCSTASGFLATTIELDNYRRVWARDGCIMGLAALMTADADLIETCRRTLETLVARQGPHGEIPSNVDPITQRVSYGGTAGRVDADLWFVICCGQYWRRTGDDEFMRRMLKPLERVRILLGAWEYNARGLLYVPQTGDWADEYINTGYVLYDQLLYLQAQREFSHSHRHLHRTTNHQLNERIARLRHLIRSNFWFPEDGRIPDDVYHTVLYKKGQTVAHRCCDKYWVSFFAPTGYGYRFDTLANVLTSLVGVADEHQRQRVDTYIAEEITTEGPKLLPAFHPVITTKDEDWEELQMSFSYVFKNKPYEYHNGGLWPFVTGFYVSDLARRGKRQLAREYLLGLNRANASSANGEDWSFPEFLNGQTYEPGGTLRLGWSAAAAVIGQKSLEGEELFLADPGG